MAFHQYPEAEQTAFPPPRHPMKLSLPGWSLSLLVVGLSLPFTRMAAQCLPAPSGLVAWFRAEGNLDSSFGNLVGKPSPTVHFIPGEVGQGFRFDGTGGFQLNSSSDLELQDFSIETWARRADLSRASAGYYPSGTFFGGGAGSYTFGITGDGLPLLSQVGISQVLATNRINDLNWHHLAVTKNASNVSFYIDGNPAGSSANYGPVFSFPTPFAVGSLGQSFGNDWYGFWGDIDEVSVYSRPLSSNEISGIYQAGSVGKCFADAGVTFGNPPGRVELGEPVFLSARVFNAGTITIGNAQLTVPLPTNAVATVLPPIQGSVTNFAGSLLFQPGPLSPGAIAALSFTLTWTNAGLQQVTASLTHDGPDTQTNNNMATASLTVLNGCTTLPDGAVSWWPAEGSVSDSLGVDDGSSMPGLSYVPGVSGQALHLDGYSWAQLQHPETLPTGDLTVEGWVRRDFTDKSSLFWDPSGVIIGGGYGAFSLVLDRDGKLFVSRVGIANYYSTAILSDTQWHYVAVAATSNRLDFYVDGGPAGSVATAGPFVTGGPFAVGGLGTLVNNSRYSLLGSIDELTVYSRILDPSQLSAIYQAGASGKCNNGISLLPGGTAAAQPGSLFTTSFVVENRGSRALTGLILSNAWPDGFVFVTNSNIGGSSALADHALITTLDSIPVGGTSQVTLTGHSDAPGWIKISASLQSSASNATLLQQTTASVEILGPCTPPPGGLAAWFRAEGNSDDALQHSATFNSPEYGPGRVGEGFVFDGSNELAIPDAPEWDIASFTAEAWVYPALLDGRVNIILNKESGSYFNQFQYELGIKGPLNDVSSTIPQGNVAFYLGGVAGLPNEYGGWVDGMGAAPVGKWTHVALTVTPTTVTVYVNGIATRTISGLGGTINRTPGPLRLGSRSPQILASSPTEGFKGGIDEFSFYQRALNADEIAAIYRAGGAGKCPSTFPVVIAAPPADQVGLVGTNVLLSVSALGSPPLSYQWQYNHQDLPGATNAQYSIPGARRTASGLYTVKVCNPAGCAADASAQVSINPGPAVLTLPTVTAPALSTVVVPVNLVANGVENAVGFSVQFDPSLLTFEGADVGPGAGSAQLLVKTAPTGLNRVGILLGLPAGVAFPEGTNEIVELTFSTSQTQSDRISRLQFSENPTATQLVDTNAQSVAVNLIGGSVTVQAVQLEGDVSPAPLGDHQVTVTDWVQVGRYVAGLDDVSPALFQRADCAPLATSGDGRLTVIDWVQAGRFAAGLDPLAAAGGPTSPVQPTPGIQHPHLQSLAPRIVRLIPSRLSSGQNDEISVILTASGEENAVAFSVHYDPSVLRFEGYVPGADLTNASFNLNTRGGAEGKLGVALALSAGTHLPKAVVELLRLRFVPAGNSAAPSNLGFGDSPVYRQICSSLAVPLPSDWIQTGLNVAIPSLTVRSQKTKDSEQVVLSWSTEWPGAILQSAANALSADWSAVNAPSSTNGGTISITLPVTPNGSFFRLRVP